MAKVAVIDVLRRFLPAYKERNPVLCGAQRRAIWAIEHCRTPVMGGHLYACDDCNRLEFRPHSCNHRSCPQCGKSATSKWVERELAKRVNAPYFMVTFTLPKQLRWLFVSKFAASAIDCLFASSSGALKDKLSVPNRRWLGAETHGFTGVLHTWNQRLGLHPHIHYIVPGCGLDAIGQYVQVKSDKFLVPLPVLKEKYRELFQERARSEGWEVDPAVWDIEWGINIRPFGDGANAIKYLGAYVSKAVIGDSRIVSIDGDMVTFRWKNRDAGDRIETETISGM